MISMFLIYSAYYYLQDIFTYFFHWYDMWTYKLFVISIFLLPWDWWYCISLSPELLMDSHLSHKFISLYPHYIVFVPSFQNLSICFTFLIPSLKLSFLRILVLSTAVKLLECSSSTATLNLSPHFPFSTLIIWYFPTASFNPLLSSLMDWS